MGEQFGQKFADLARESVAASLRGLSRLGKVVATNAARAGERVKEAVATNHEGTSMRRCISGHYFDPARSPVCPLCESHHTSPTRASTEDAAASRTGGENARGAKAGADARRNDVETQFDQLTGDSAANTRATSRGAEPAAHDAPTHRKELAPDSAAGGGRIHAETLSFMLREQGIDPVVGWLVCIEGADRGRDYRIRSERNFIGRASTMDIIMNDESVSRENHAVLIFNPRKSTFKLQPGGSRGLVYLNSEEVLGPVDVNSGDLIELGKSKLLFVPFVNQYHRWSTEE